MLASCSWLSLAAGAPALSFLAWAERPARKSLPIRSDLGLAVGVLPLPGAAAAFSALASMPLRKSLSSFCLVGVGLAAGAGLVGLASAFGLASGLGFSGFGFSGFGF